MISARVVLTLLLAACPVLAQEPAAAPAQALERTDAELVKGLFGASQSRISALEEDNERLTKEAANADEERNNLATELATRKFIRFGLTGGVAAAAILPTADPFQQEAADYQSISGPAGGVMPYLMVVPWYFISQANEPLRAYCSSADAGETADATIAAMAVAQRKSKLVLNAIVDALVSGMAPEDVARSFQFFFAYEDSSREASKKAFVSQIVAALPSAGAADRAKKIQEIKDDEARLSTLTSGEWNPSMVGRCGFLSKVGVWIGVPVTVTQISSTIPEHVDATTSELIRANRDLKNLAALGLALAPNAYFSLMLGVGFGTMDQKALQLSDRTTVSASSQLQIYPVVAVGGNLDFPSLFAK